MKEFVRGNQSINGHYLNIIEKVYGFAVSQSLEIKIRDYEECYGIGYRSYRFLDGLVEEVLFDLERDGFVRRGVR